MKLTASKSGELWDVSLSEGAVVHSIRLAAESIDGAVSAAYPTLKVWHRDWLRSKRKKGE